MRYNRQIIIMIAVVILSCFLLNGCGSVSNDKAKVTPALTPTQIQNSMETETPNPTVSEVTVIPKEVRLPIDSDLRFVFSSGAGGWRTLVILHPDGTFEGNYYDSNFGERGEGYDGSCNVCDFSGEFGDVQKVSENVYSMKIVSISQVQPTGKEEIVEETTSSGTYQLRYVYSDPYGMGSNGCRFELYIPGTPVSDLPEGYTSWVIQNASLRDNIQLPFYGLYNVDESCGMYSSDDDFLN